jgi:hypothetical protein
LYPAAPAAEAGAIALSSDLFLDGAARVGSIDQADSISDSQGAATDPLSISLDVTATDPTFVSTSTSRGNMSLFFSGASSGTFFFEGLGWETADVADGAASISASASYSFRADGAGQILNLVYAATLAGTDTSGLGNYFVTLTSILGSETLEVDLTGAGLAFGVLEFGLEDDIDYKLSIDVGSNISGSLGTRTALSDGVLAFNIVAAVVPEPSSLALSISGVLGAAGLTLKRRRLA